MKLLYNLSYAILTVIIFSHCGKNINEYSNKPPVANAGRDTSITLPLDSIKLDGSASYDADGQIIFYEWRRIEGPAGGYTGDTNHPIGGYMSNRVEMRDILNKQVTIGCLFQPNAKFAAVKKNNNVIFFTGEGPQKDRFDIYHISNKSWSVGVLPQRLESSAIISINNNAYVAGGKVDGVITNQVYKLEF